MTTYPRVLFVDSSYGPAQHESPLWEGVIDYRIYETVPRWWRKFEESIRLDFVLAFRARKLAKNFEVIFAGSEKVGVLLTFMNANRPVLCLAHHMASRLKKRLLRLAGIPKHWNRIGYFSSADRDFVASYFDISVKNMFPYSSAPIDRIFPGPKVIDGPIISSGVVQRDYVLLIKALRELPGCTTEIHASSRFGDCYLGNFGRDLPDWVSIEPSVSPEEFAQRFRRARFVVIPLINSTCFSAGSTTALEAHAAGKAVIATKTAGTTDYVIHGVTGFLVPPNDPSSLRNAISELWNHPESAYQMGLAGRRHVESHFDPEKVMQQIRKAVCEAHLEFQSKTTLEGNRRVQRYRVNGRI